MFKVGLMVGRERSFPDALIDRMNRDYGGKILTEYATVGAARMNAPSGYDVIIDRISHEVPFYRALLKNAALTGTRVVNNPFWWSADDKFFNYALVDRLKMDAPRTALLPQKEYVEEITADSLSNLEYPLRWHDVLEYVGLPAIVKPHDGGGWRDVYKIGSMEELIQVYDGSGQNVMMLQEFISFDRYVRCYCIGQQDVHIMPYDPDAPHESRYVQTSVNDYIGGEMAADITRRCIRICQALGYDFNTLEFAIRGGIPYAIDYMNPAPDADRHSVGEANFQWVLDATARLIERLVDEDPDERPLLRYDVFLRG